LDLDIEVFLVEGLEQRVQEPTERRALGLLDDLGAGLLGIVLGCDGAQPVLVQVVLGLVLVGGAGDELEAVGGDADGLEDGVDDARIVVGAVRDEVDGRFEVVEEGVDVGEEDDDVDPGLEEVRWPEDSVESTFPQRRTHQSWSRGQSSPGVLRGH
jgi:hypothetical protein